MAMPFYCLLDHQLHYQEQWAQHLNEQTSNLPSFANVFHSNTFFESSDRLITRMKMDQGLKKALSPRTIC